MTQLALVIDLNVCVGCHACVTSCKSWNTSGESGTLIDENPYGKDPTGTFFNRVQTYEVGQFPATETVHFPKSCLHCEEPPCVPVCPTGASYKRESDGLVLAFLVPILLLGNGLARMSSGLLFVAAFILQYIGLLAERWFFFAQANHPQNLYYQQIS